MDQPYYDIVVGVNYQNLIEKVNEKQKLGYVTAGGVAILPSTSMGATFYQAMTYMEIIPGQVVTLTEGGAREILDVDDKMIQESAGAIEESKAKPGRPKKRN